MHDHDDDDDREDDIAPHRWSWLALLRIALAFLEFLFRNVAICLEQVGDEVSSHAAFRDQQRDMVDQARVEIEALTDARPE